MQKIDCRKVECRNCEEKCGKGKAPTKVVEELECRFKRFLISDGTSLLRKYLSFEIFERLKKKKTTYRMTLLDCVQSGFENPDGEIGIYAADPECYELFADLFDLIIQEYHDDFKRSYIHPDVDFGDPKLSALADLDPSGKIILSTRIRGCRSISGYPFNPGMTEEQYQEIEDQVVEILDNDLSDDLLGTYITVDDLIPDEQLKLIEDHYLFPEGDRFLQDANACHHWPTGRGIFFNPTKTFIVWINEEDHLRIISFEPGANLSQVYGRWVNGMKQLEKKLCFTKHERFGYLTMNPKNLGTTIRVSFHMQLPNLSQNVGLLKGAADEMNLLYKRYKDDVFEISNKRRLGLTEIDVLKEVATGIKYIVKTEKG